MDYACINKRNLLYSLSLTILFIEKTPGTSGNAKFRQPGNFRQHVMIRIFHKSGVFFLNSVCSMKASFTLVELLKERASKTFQVSGSREQEFSIVHYFCRIQLENWMSLEKNLEKPIAEKKSAPGNGNPLKKSAIPATVLPLVPGRHLQNW